MRTGSTEDLLRSLKPGQRVFFQGGPGECVTFHDALKNDPGLINRLDLWSCLIPGINALDYGSLPNDHKLTTFMASLALEPSIASGRTQIMAMPYSQIGETLAKMEFDVAIFHVSPPNAEGACSFGLSCDMPSLVWPNAERRVAFVNERMPHLPGAEGIPLEVIDLAIPINEPLLAGSSPRRNTVVEKIAARAAALIPDGATIQSGIGDTPAAIAAALRLHRGLKVHSGIITGEYQQLAESGALDPDAEHVTGIAWGDGTFQAWLPRSGFLFRSALETHSHAKLAAIPNFVSIGSALEVDLAGNLNLEWRAGRRVSSIGGAPDYIRGASLSPGGRSIIALQSTSGGASRIVPALQAPSIPGALIDTVVTEHGVAELRGLEGAARAAALTAIAAPEHRSFLESTKNI
ncbi:MAG: acetyl-CoA hydrolase/transferase C-terminal domain-containing protein [Hyphomonadaceae bacterium]